MAEHNRRDWAEARTGLRPSRRWVIHAAATTGILGFAGSGSAQSTAEEIELAGDTPGWEGRDPDSIAGETNPTLSLTAGTEYALEWENVDGAPHNFAIYDEDESALVQTENVAEEGETQTVEFEATTEMVEYICEVHPTTMRGDIQIEDADGGEDADEDSDDDTDGEEQGFDPETLEIQQGELAEVTLSLGDDSASQVTIGLSAANYVVSFTVVDEDDDDEVTFELDTFAAGRLRRPAVSVVGEEDTLVDARRETPTLTNPLDPAVYPLRARVDGRLIGQGRIVLGPRETIGASAGVAPQDIRPIADEEEMDEGEDESNGDEESEEDEGGFLGSVSTGDEVAVGDWAVFIIEASGHVGTLEDTSAFRDEALGYELTIEETPAFNQEPDPVPLEDISLVSDQDNDRLYVVVDSATLREETTYEAEFTITDANPYLDTDEEESVAAEFSVVERTASFGDGEGLGQPSLNVPPEETTISGTTTVAPGTTLNLMIQGTGENTFIRSAQADVADDGTWSASVDFSGLEGATFQASLLDLSETIDGEVTSG